MGMRILVVAREKENGFAPFVTEQVEALEKKGINCQFFPMKGTGISGYLRQLPAFRKIIHSFKPDIIHAHYGLCGLFANLQRRIPVVTTYHGSDINNPGTYVFSKIAIWLSAFNIFVSQKNINRVTPRRNYALIPCGINLQDYPKIEKADARRQMGLEQDRKYILFAGAFDNAVKNPALAQASAALLPGAQLLELKGYTRSQVAVLMQAVDVLLMTSKTEGSPQVIKEALACACPIVSVDVGDVRERINGVDGCWIVEPLKGNIADAIKKAFSFSGRTLGREGIIASGLTNTTIADKLLVIYKSLK